MVKDLMISFCLAVDSSFDYCSFIRNFIFQGNNNPKFYNVTYTRQAKSQDSIINLGVDQNFVYVNLSNETLFKDMKLQEQKCRKKPPVI